MSIAEKPPELQPHVAMPPRIDVTERYLLRLFLRRYIAWCARRRRFAAMQGPRAWICPQSSPRGYYLNLNRVTAASLGLQLPQALLVRADELIQYV